MRSFMIAVGDHLEMGLDNHLPWHLPKEVHYFRLVTEFHTILMGRKTFESLPQVLSNRKHIVLTTNPTYGVDHPDVSVVHDVEAALKLLPQGEESFIIGGAEIFRLFLPYADRIYITWVHGTFQADTWFPSVPWEEWDLIKEWPGDTDEENLIPHTFQIWDLKRK